MKPDTLIFKIEALKKQMINVTKLDDSGIYILFFSADKKKYQNRSNNIYVGMTKDFRSRLTNHNVIDEWRKMYCDATELSLAVTSVKNEEDRKKIEKALIFITHPLVNQDHNAADQEYDGEDISIELIGITIRGQKLLELKKGEKRNPLLVVSQNSDILL